MLKSPYDLPDLDDFLKRNHLFRSSWNDAHKIEPLRRLWNMVVLVKRFSSETHGYSLGSLRLIISILASISSNTCTEQVHSTIRDEYVPFIK